MLKKVILASSGYSLITFVHGFTWHLVFFKQVYETFGVYNRANPIIPIGFASMVIQGVVLAVLYHRQVKEIPAPSFKMAIEFNLLMGLFFTSGTVLALAAKAEIHHLSAWFVYNAGFALIQFLLSGVLFGFVFKKPPSELSANRANLPLH